MRGNLRRPRPLREDVQNHRIRRPCRRGPKNSDVQNVFKLTPSHLSYASTLIYQLVAFKWRDTFGAELGPSPTEEIEGEDAVAVVFRLAAVEAAQDEHGIVQDLTK